VTINVDYGVTWNADDTEDARADAERLKVVRTLSFVLILII